MRSFFQNSLSKVTFVAVAVLGLSLTATADNFRAINPNANQANWNSPQSWEKQDPLTLNWATGADVPNWDDNVLIDGGNIIFITNPVISCNSLTITAPANSSGIATSRLDVGSNNFRVYSNLTIQGGASQGGGRNAELLLSTGLVEIKGNLVITPNDYNRTTITDPAGLIQANKTSINPLPVELISFKAVKNTSGVSLTWETASEKNNTGFEVQSSTDGKNYERIGFVASANGTSSSLQRYAFTDKASNKEGLAYYRLKQIDLDGTFEFFAAKVVDLGRTGSAVSAYPNPFQNQFAVNLTSTVAEAAVITVTDMTGKTVYTTTAQLQKGSNTLNVTLKDQPAGIYMLNATAGNQTYINRLVKQ